MTLKLIFNILGLASLMLLILLLVLEAGLLVAGGVASIAVYAWRHFWFTNG